ncbi:hypothetical protein BD410DRAFT_897941 [Rickenella mellea]|uniref:Uncharacterized protein n=1 Tax=Rickenella mellea TaxID=50990 RepID=A0A4Y7Q545_9AGAM|nr:hypothetical protein BD410DRAFT_897941 [Rickenella mellea]
MAGAAEAFEFMGEGTGESREAAVDVSPEDERKAPEDGSQSDGRSDGAKDLLSELCKAEDANGNGSTPQFTSDSSSVVFAGEDAWQPPVNIPDIFVVDEPGSRRRRRVWNLPKRAAVRQNLGPEQLSLDGLRTTGHPHDQAPDDNSDAEDHASSTNASVAVPNLTHGQSDEPSSLSYSFATPTSSSRRPRSSTSNIVDSDPLLAASDPDVSSVTSRCFSLDPLARRRSSSLLPSPFLNRVMNASSRSLATSLDLYKYDPEDIPSPFSLSIEDTAYEHSIDDSSSFLSTPSKLPSSPRREMLEMLPVLSKDSTHGLLPRNERAPLSSVTNRAANPTSEVDSSPVSMSLSVRDRVKMARKKSKVALTNAVRRISSKLGGKENEIR